MTKKILSALIVMLAGTNAFAASHYIRAAASGAHNGTDWTNAWTSFSQVSWTRGDIYYIAAGSYGSVTLSQGASGSTVIEIRAAVSGSGDHGTATGWSDGFQGQALLGASTITSNYWTINAQAVPGCVYPTDTPSCHLIKFNNPSTGGQALQLGSGSQVTNVRLDYIEAQGSNVHSSSTDEGIQCTPGPCNNTYIGHAWVHNVGCDNLAFDENVGQNFTVEYSWISYNNFGPTAPGHCQGLMSTFSTMILRFNVWQDIQSSGVITDAAGGNATLTEWDIYGNIFFWDAAWNAQWRGNGVVGEDNGIVGLYNVPNNTGNLRFYNNTVDGLALSSGQNCTAQVAYLNSGNVVNLFVENNIWSNIASNCGTGPGASGTVDHNLYVNASKGDSGSQSTSSSTNPYVNQAAATVAGYMLKADTPAGATLPSPFNTDLLGTTRASSGVWDIGALQISGTSSSLPPMPQGLHVVSVQ